MFPGSESSQLPTAEYDWEPEDAWRCQSGWMSSVPDTGVLSGVAATPGFLPNRIGLLLLGTSVFWIGVVFVSIGAVLHVTASSSVRVVKLSLRLRPGQQEPHTATG
jgi:hypothetical protein